MIKKNTYTAIIKDLTEKGVTLVAVSKTKPQESIKELYDLGQRDFGENYVQELVDKQAQLPQEIHWHFIGHLQSNKVKYIASFVHLIHGVDSYKLLVEINKQAAKNNRVIHVLLQVHIAQEETKFGLDENELDQMFNANQNQLSALQNIMVEGFMGMASFTDNKEQVRKEFKYLKSIFEKYKHVQIANCKIQTLSMGMSGDYLIAIEEGSNMVRIGSLIFGERNYIS
ncbi:YggS family pyridoxal phosphate-dependent enzyme [Chitinophagaceae bacterium LB-8]|uniref:Pyridoxal phosphate homeostasis protein n=1 Tax=Paraflavisolibacter caeni TaxID=2982496 RepID=A0A9X3B987_9BACT|nr:YggS family pyridoxal phosphate-dependent enzyme [Paraflavisolibacter caeni]MCU7550821.1 YggS family pyridoxal phosphate-dependent enzyme [Paraflavisolibacter caeni]